jgi:hypothetical protein
MLDDQFQKQGKRSADGSGTAAVARLVEDQVSRRGSDCSCRTDSSDRRHTHPDSIQFEGKVMYGVRCGSCGNASERQETYRELEITLKVS